MPLKALLAGLASDRIALRRLVKLLADRRARHLIRVDRDYYIDGQLAFRGAGPGRGPRCAGFRISFDDRGQPSVDHIISARSILDAEAIRQLAADAAQPLANSPAASSTVFAIQNRSEPACASSGDARTSYDPAP